jgi:ribosomal protein S27AE
MQTWRLKGCIRCGGNVFIEHDSYGWYLVCIQCGYHKELDIPNERRKKPAEEMEGAGAGYTEEELVHTMANLPRV